MVVSAESRRTLLAAWEPVVCEGGVRTDEDLIFDAETVPQLDARLDGHTVADDHVVFDKDVVADTGIGTDASPAEHVSERPDSRSRTEVRGLQSGIGVHEDPFRLQAHTAGSVRRRTLGEFAGLLRKAAHRRQANTTLALG